MATEFPVTLYPEPGPEHTEMTLQIAGSRALELGLQHAVVATDSGKTARLALERLRPLEVVAVTNPAGIRLPVGALHDYLPKFKAFKQGLIDQGVDSVAASVDQAEWTELQALGARTVRVDWNRLVQYTRTGLNDLDRIGVAVRVATVVSVSALLEGAIPVATEVLALAGTGFGGGGSDTALVIRTAERWRDWRICEILCRPRIGPPSEGS